MAKLILVRHGQSTWNQLNLFTGWVDVPLSSKGIEEALYVGNIIKDVPIDVIFVSTLVRAQMTAFLAMSVHHSGKVPVLHHAPDTKLGSWAKIYSGSTLERTIPTYAAWELNERMYGELQGLNKGDTIEKYGLDQVQKWRRSYSIAPPNGESLEMTAERTIPYFESTITPYLRQGKNVLVCAHGNSLRSIMMGLDKLSKEQVVHLELQTGLPIIYDFDGEFTKIQV